MPKIIEDNSSKIDPANPRRLVRSILISATMNREARVPQIINPELKIGDTFDTPRSLSALSIQLNHGERAIEIPIDISPQIGAITPNHVAILGLIIFSNLILLTIEPHHALIYSSY